MTLETPLLNTLSTNQVETALLSPTYSAYVSKLALALEFQLPSACAPALVKGTFNYSDINKDVGQTEIMKEIYDSQWDGSPPDKICMYLDKFYLDVGYHQNLRLSEASLLISEGRLLYVLWRDDLLDSDFAKSEGHWDFLGGVDKKLDLVTKVDPSNAKRLYRNGQAILGIPKALNGLRFERRKVYNLDAGYFKSRWWDILPTGEVGTGIAISIDPFKLK